MRRKTHVIKTLIFVSVLLATSLGVTLCTFADQNSAQNTKPYNAKTADECIQEKECVWHEFTNLITQSGLEKRKEWRLSRWEVPVQIKIIGTGEAEEHRESIHQSLEILDRYFPGRIAVSDKKINFFIAFTNSIKDDFYNRDYGFWKKAFGHNVAFIEQAINANQGGDAQCVQITMHNTEYKNIVGILFVDKRNPQIQSCLWKGLKSAWTAPHYLTPYLEKYNPHKFKDHKINRLDLFLQALLYDPNFHTNMAFSQVEKAFDQAYADTLNRFGEQLERERV